MKKIFFLLILLLLQTGCTTVMIPILVGTAVTTATLLMIEERSIGNSVDDTSILIRINKNLLANDLFSSVRVQVSEGRVLLSGKVHSIEQQIEVEKIAWEQKGVREVINEVTVTDRSIKPSQNISQSAKDAIITAQIRAKMIPESKVRMVNYSIRTVDGVVYLIGIAQNKEELIKITAYARKVKGVKQVVSYVRLKDSKLRD